MCLEHIYGSVDDHWRGIVPMSFGLVLGVEFIILCVYFKDNGAVPLYVNIIICIFYWSMGIWGLIEVIVGCCKVAKRARQWQDRMDSGSEIYEIGMP